MYYNALNLESEGEKSLAFESYLKIITSKELIGQSILKDAYSNALGILIEYCLDSSAVNYTLKKLPQERSEYFKYIVNEGIQVLDETEIVECLKFYFDSYYLSEKQGLEKLNTLISRNKQCLLGSVVKEIYFFDFLSEEDKLQIEIFKKQYKDSKITLYKYFFSLIED